MRNLIAAISFLIAVMGGLAAMFIAQRDRQTMATIVAVAFLISFFINVNWVPRFFLQTACLISFAVAMIGAGTAVMARHEEKRTGAAVAGIVALGVSLLILFAYL